MRCLECSPMKRFLICKEKHEDEEKKTKSVSLKVESKEAMQDDDLNEEENITFPAKKFGKFIQKITL